MSADKTSGGTYLEHANVITIIHISCKSSIRTETMHVKMLIMSNPFALLIYHTLYTLHTISTFRKISCLKGNSWLKCESYCYYL